MQEIDYRSPSDAFVASIDIHTLLPQQEPFVMIGRLSHFDMEEVTTRTPVTADNIFVDNGVMTASGIIENIAQTCAARIGYINKYILKKGIQIGFIGAVRNLKLHRLPEVGEELCTEVRVESEVFGLILATATVGASGSSVASAEIKIAIREDKDL